MLPYVSAVFAGTLLPYAIARIFLHRSPMRWMGFALFLFYSMSHLQKALFLKVVTPLGYLAARRLIWTYVGLFLLIVGSVGLVYTNTVLARGVQDDAYNEEILKESERLAGELTGRSGNRSARAPQSDHALGESVRDECYSLLTSSGPTSARSRPRSM